MFGLREPFRYLDCAECGCLQIERVPDDLARYYPNGYYSHTALRDLPLKSYLKRRWLQHHRGRPNLVGRAVTTLKGAPWFPPSLERISPSAAVLDVGCGTGHMLLQLRDAGFRDLTGIDPYIERDLHYRGGVSVFKQPLSALQRPYDLVMLHHSFEHMGDPHEVLRELRRLIKPAGCLLIRTPVARSYAWELYRENWVQIDAPRHLVVHSEQSLGLVARAAGFDVTNIVYDSTAFQFWGSVQYEHDIPLHDERSYAVNPKRSMFTAARIRAWEEEATALNAAGKGDQACFYLRKRPVGEG